MPLIILHSSFGLSLVPSWETEAGQPRAQSVGAEEQKNGAPPCVPTDSAARPGNNSVPTQYPVRGEGLHSRPTSEVDPRGRYRMEGVYQAHRRACGGSIPRAKPHITLTMQYLPEIDCEIPSLDILTLIFGELREALPQSAPLTSDRLTAAMGQAGHRHLRGGRQ